MQPIITLNVMQLSWFQVFLHHSDNREDIKVSVGLRVGFGKTIPNSLIYAFESIFHLITCNIAQSITVDGKC